MELYSRLDTKEGISEINRLAKEKERKTKYLIHVKCVKGKGSESCNKWRRYKKKMEKDFFNFIK